VLFDGINRGDGRRRQIFSPIRCRNLARAAYSPHLARPFAEVTPTPAGVPRFLGVVSITHKVGHHTQPLQNSKGRYRS